MPFGHIKHRKKYLSRRRDVIVHIDAADLEQVVLSRRVTSPTQVAVGPVVPQPRAGLVGHISRVSLLERTVDVEASDARHPVDAVLVLGRGDISGRGAVRPGAVREHAVRVLVGVQKWARAVAGIGL